MPSTEQVGRGFLGKNDFKEKDTQPDYTGKVSFAGKDYRLAGWAKEKDGRKFLSLSVTEEKPRTGGADFNAPPRPTSQPVETSQTDVFEQKSDDDLPW